MRDVVLVSSPVLSAHRALASLSGILSTLPGRRAVRRVGPRSAFATDAHDNRRPRERAGARRRCRRHDRPPRSDAGHTRHPRPLVLRPQHRAGTHPGGRQCRGAREGIQAFGFTVTGPMTSRGCEVEPLSAIVPGCSGILREPTAERSTRPRTGCATPPPSRGAPGGAPTSASSPFATAA